MLFFCVTYGERENLTVYSCCSLVMRYLHETKVKTRSQENPRNAQEILQAA